MIKDRAQRDGLLLVFIAAAGFALFPIFTKAIYEAGGLEPLDILTWRFLLATPLTWLFLSARRVPTSALPLPRYRLMSMGVVFAFTSGSAFFALERIPASTFTVVIYSYPAMVAVLSLLLGERLSRRGWLALGLTLIGIALTVPDFQSGLSDLAGVMFTLLNASTYALYIVISGWLLRGHTALARASAWSITGSFAALVLLTVFRGLAWPSSPAVWASLLGMAVFSTVVAIFAFYAGMHRLGAARAAILSTIEPVMTLTLAALVLGETLQPIQILGAALVLCSVILLQLRRETVAFTPTPDLLLPELKQGESSRAFAHSPHSGESGGR